MSVMLFIIVLVASFTIVRIGAVAFQLTGLEWSLAKFQALSCFSGTGFTTRESELITGHPQRRKIATFLIVLGNAGLVTMIASVASALNAQQTIWAKLSGSSFELYLLPTWPTGGRFNRNTPYDAATDRLYPTCYENTGCAQHLLQSLGQA